MQFKVVVGTPAGNEELDIEAESEADARAQARGTIRGHVVSCEPVLTGDALRQAASELGIEGRSQMSADEQRAAVTEQLQLQQQQEPIPFDPEANRGRDIGDGRA